MKTICLVLGAIGFLFTISGCGKKSDDSAKTEQKAQSFKPSRWVLPRTHAPGLLSNDIRAIYEDKDGRLWFALFNGGISQYNPEKNSWQTWSTLDGLSDNDVMAIQEDNEDGIWLATWGGGVSRLNTRNGDWQTWKKKDGLASNEVRTLLKDSAGRFWFGTSNGVSRFNPTTGKWLTKRKKDGLANNDVRAIYGDTAGRFWFGTWGGGVSRYDPTNGRWQTWKKEDGLADNNVRAVHGDKKGQLWFATSSGVSRVDLGTGQWKTLTTNDGLVHNGVQTIHEDKVGQLWFGTWGGGISRFEPTSGQWQSWSTDDKLPSNFVQAIHEDRTGKLWFGTWRGGVSVFEPTGNEWMILTKKLGLIHNHTNDIHEDRTGKIWFATNSGAVRFSPDRGEWKTFHDEKCLKRSVILAIHEDTAGKLWFGTSGHGVCRFDPKTDEWVSWTTKEGLRDNTVKAIHEDRRGRIWVGTAHGGASRFDSVKKTWQTWTKADGLPDNDVNFIYSDIAGGIWLATANGLGKITWDGKTWKAGTQNAALPDNTVYSICQDSEQRIWFGTAGGVSRFDHESGLWHTWTTRDGLPENDVRTIIEDSSERVWVGTWGGGISCFDRTNEKWHTLAKEAKLPHRYINTLHAGTGNRLWFGAREGLGHIDPFSSNKSHRQEMGSMLAIKKDFHSLRMAINGHVMVLSQGIGLTFVDIASDNPVVKAVLPEWPTGSTYTSLASHPDGRVWAGTLQSGLVLSGPDNKHKHLVVEEKSSSTYQLPSMSVREIVPVPGSDGQSVWVSTNGGAALVQTDPSGLPFVKRVANWEIGLPAGPVNALAVGDEGLLFLGFNAVDPLLSDYSGLAKRRAKSSIWQISQSDSEQLEAVPLLVDDLFLGSRIYSLALGKTKGGSSGFSKHVDVLYIGTSSGLFFVPLPISYKNKISRVTAKGRLSPAPVRHLAVEPDGTVWIATEKQKEVPQTITGYEPGSEELVILGESDGVPQGSDIERIFLTEQGDLVVIAGNKVVRGNVFVPQTTNMSDWILISISVLGMLIILIVVIIYIAVFRHPTVLTLRNAPEQLLTFPLNTLPTAISRLQRARSLQEVWDQIKLPVARQKSMKLFNQTPNEAVNRLEVLLSLLEARKEQKVNRIADGIWISFVKLYTPEPLREHVTAIVTVDWSSADASEPAALIHALENALANGGQATELPFILVSLGAHDKSEIRTIVPPRYEGLILDDDALRNLVFATNPQRTFAGMLHTQGHLALSPYSISGEVKESDMFFGRERLIREIVNTGTPRHIIVGPRRVGKSSLLRQLQRTLKSKRPNLDVHYLDLMGVESPERALNRLQKTLDVTVQANSDSIPVYLGNRFADADKPGLLLIDEVDGLIATDARDGYPVLTALRTLQAEGLCSYVMTGYQYLYRSTHDQTSPLFNFATIEVLGALGELEAMELATAPMARLGITYEDDGIPRTIARRTGGYPSFVQLLCHQVLKELKHGRLVIENQHIESAENENAVRDQLQTIFEMNVTDIAAKVLVYRLVGRPRFSIESAHNLLKSIASPNVPVGKVETILRDLIIFGFLTEEGGQYSWTIPILCDIIARADPYIAVQLEKELSEQMAS